jgi:hypothetical protein
VSRVADNSVTISKPAPRHVGAHPAQTNQTDLHRPHLSVAVRRHSGVASRRELQAAATARRGHLQRDPTNYGTSRKKGGSRDELGPSGDLPCRLGGGPRIRRRHRPVPHQSSICHAAQAVSALARQSTERHGGMTGDASKNDRRRCRPRSSLDARSPGCRCGE